VAFWFSKVHSAGRTALRHEVYAPHSTPGFTFWAANAMNFALIASAWVITAHSSKKSKPAGRMRRIHLMAEALFDCRMNLGKPKCHDPFASSPRLLQSFSA